MHFFIFNLFNDICTQEYEGQLRSHVNKQLEPVLKDLKEATNKQKIASELEKKLTHVIRNEIRDAATKTPVTPVTRATPNASMPTFAEIQAQITTKLGEGLLNEAFSLALSSNNLAIVVATCEMVNPDQIFAREPCPLSQEVLLSLIQQLGEFMVHINKQLSVTASVSFNSVFVRLVG